MLKLESWGDQMIIKDVDLSKYDAIVMDDYNVGSASVESNALLGSASTMPVGYGIKIGMKPIDIPIAFVCSTTIQAIKQKSNLAATLCSGTVEIYDDENDFYYSAVFNGLSDEKILMPGVYTVTFQFSGIMHGKLISFVQSGAFTPEGYTEDGEDCRLSVTVSNLESDGSFRVGGIKFKSSGVSTGSKIIIDGFNKTVFINGANGMQYCDLISFPRVYPGKSNYIDCKDSVTIEYYPVYK